MITKDQIRNHGIEACGRFYGSYLGIVVDWKDPLSANRLLIRVPEVYGDTNVRRIALPGFGVMGPNYGSHFIPKQGAQVWVQFRQGDPDYPIWSPGPYKDNEAPKELFGPEMMGVKSRGGHMVIIDDLNDTIIIRHKDEQTIELRKDKIILGNDVRVYIEDDKVTLGKEQQQPAVMGDDLKDWLQTLSDLVKDLIIDPSDGPQKVNITNITQIENHKAKLDGILAKF